MLLITLLRLLVLSLRGLGLSGALHPMGDSFAVLLFPVACLGLLLLGLPGHRGFRGVLVVPTLTALGFITLERVPLVRAGEVAVYQKNLSFRNSEVEGVVHDIAGRDPEIVMLQEVTLAHRNVIYAPLSKNFSTWHWCAFASVGGTAVASKWPAVEGPPICSKRGGLSAVKVRSPHGEIWIASVHLHWPWPYRQGDQLEVVLPILAGLDGPVIIGGDFNMVPWSHALRQVAKATKTRRAGGVRPTLWRRNVPLPIDHVFAPGGGRIETLPRLGSDHQGVLARVNF